MKARRTTAALILLGAAAVTAGCRGASSPGGTLKGTISLSGAWALYPMAVKWAEEFRKVQPTVRIDVQAGGAGKGMADALAGMADFGMVSREVHPEETAKGALAFSVAKDGVVATVSARNPHLLEIMKRGLPRETFVGVWISGTVKTWREALGLKGEGASSPIHVFTRSDACGAADTWAAYLGGKQEDLGGVGVYGDPGLADAVKRDPLAVGYNNINFAYDPRTLRPIEGLAVVPIDFDGSGTIEPAEAVYATRDDVTGAILRKVYPSPPARDLYLVSKGHPAAGAAAEFLRWILTEGQRFVSETGFIPVAPEQLIDGLAKLK